MIYRAKMPEAYARVKWCKEHFGRPFQDLPKEQRSWEKMRWWRQGGYLCFRNQYDFFMYKLVWND